VQVHRLKTCATDIFHGLRVSRQLMFNCPEFYESVAPASRR
jgi:hypothetical protein